MADGSFRCRKAVLNAGSGYDTGRRRGGGGRQCWRRRKADLVRETDLGQAVPF
ncbi:unnamed protein product [Spirodela intermedia]|uniref:Uncharacterized protein n=1 Tax=Spirodela intermedia TaxID=51605 RepID=A0A7I8L1Q8_SPIIN|nr:unnamed protein product [Spirodela intermedia]